MMYFTVAPGLRSILRGHRRTPATVTDVVLSLGIAIAGGTVIYSAIDTALGLVLPFRERDRLVYVASTNPQRGQARMGVSVPDFIDWSRQGSSMRNLPHSHSERSP